MSPPIRRQTDRPSRFRRRAPYLLVAAFVAAVAVWSAGARLPQMGSAFGRALVPVACHQAQADWPAASVSPGALRSDRPALRAVTYNLHSGLGPDWRLFRSRAAVERELRAVARHVAAAAPAAAPVDVVGLNEVDFGSRRSGWLDQPALLAAELQALTGHAYRVLRAETWRRDLPGMEVRFGNALLVRHPVLAVRSCVLGATCTRAGDGEGSARWPGEARGLLQVRLDVHGQKVDVLLTHLESLVLQQREAQATEILGMVGLPGSPPTLLLGDINAVPAAQTHARRLFAADRTHDILTSGALVDARVAAAAARGMSDLSPWATYPARAPLWPLDGIFATPELAPQAVRVIGGLESDHRGLAVEYRWLMDAGTVAYRIWHDAVREHQLARIVACDFAVREPGWLARAAALVSATGFFGPGVVTERR